MQAREYASVGIAADVTRAAAPAASVVSRVQIHVDMQLKYSTFGTCSLYMRLPLSQLLQ